MLSCCCLVNLFGWSIIKDRALLSWLQLSRSVSWRLEKVPQSPSEPSISPAKRNMEDQPEPAGLAIVAQSPASEPELRISVEQKLVASLLSEPELRITVEQKPVVTLLSKEDDRLDGDRLPVAVQGQAQAQVQGQAQVPAAEKIEAAKPTSAPQATVITKKPSSTTNAAGLTDGDVVPSQYADGEKLQLSSPRLQDAPQASPRKSKPTSAANHAAVALGGAPSTDKLKITQASAQPGKMEAVHVPASSAKDHAATVMSDAQCSNDLSSSHASGAGVGSKSVAQGRAEQQQQQLPEDALGFSINRSRTVIGTQKASKDVVKAHSQYDLKAHTEPEVTALQTLEITKAKSEEESRAPDSINLDRAALFMPERSVVTRSQALMQLLGVRQESARASPKASSQMVPYRCAGHSRSKPTTRKLLSAFVPADRADQMYDSDKTLVSPRSRVHLFESLPLGVGGCRLVSRIPLLLRRGCELSSEEVGDLPAGTTVFLMARQRLQDGSLRAQVQPADSCEDEEGYSGWASYESKSGLCNLLLSDHPAAFGVLNDVRHQKEIQNKKRAAQRAGEAREAAALLQA